jgi:hypothetical protein
MGWAESPAYFCTTTETGCDIIKWLVDAKVELPMYPSEKFTLPDPVPKGHGNGASKIHIYVDDYVLAVVQDKAQLLFRQVAWTALHDIHWIFLSQLSGHTGGKYPISENKLKKGDAMFAVIKEVPGFMLNGVNCTAWLPKQKWDAIIKASRRSNAS